MRVLAGAGEYVLASRAGELLRAAFTIATLGALHSRAGATTFVQTPSNPVSGTVGTQLDVTFTYTGTPTPPARFQVSGTLPPGLSYVPAPVGGSILSGTPAITGTPTQAGTFTISVQGFNALGNTNNVQQEIRFEITGGSTGTAPAISKQPESQTVNAGANVTLTVEATGSPLPTFQWTKNGANVPGATGASLTFSSVQVGDAGSYAVVVSNTAGSVTSATATLTVASSANVAITRQPEPQTIPNGGTVVFSVDATGATGFQWRRDGVNLPGATSAMLVIRAATAAQQGDYSVVVSGTGGPVTSQTAALTVNAGSDLGRLINLSILTTLTEPGSLFTLGTVVGGAGTSGTKPLLIRAAGPSLAPLGVADTLPDPRHQLFHLTQVISGNDNWNGAPALTAAFNQVGAFAYVSATSRDAAALEPSLAPGDYTVQVSAADAGTGSVIAELYDASPGASVTSTTPRLINVSVLKQIPAGSLLTAGFVIGGGQGGARTVLVRAIGPALAAAPFNVPGVMADPKLELFRKTASIAANDNWGGDAQLTAVGNSVGAFALSDSGSRDAILLITLTPGDYTAQVTGVSGGGTALVEVYEVP